MIPGCGHVPVSEAHDRRRGRRALLVGAVLGSGRPLYPHDASTGDQGLRGCLRPSRPAKSGVREGPPRFLRLRRYHFQFDSHIVAVAGQEFLHILDCVGWVPHVSSPRLVSLILIKVPIDPVWFKLRACPCGRRWLITE
jgi:hypothetical protein